MVGLPQKDKLEFQLFERIENLKSRLADVTYVTTVYQEHRTI